MSAIVSARQLSLSVVALGLVGVQQIWEAYAARDVDQLLRQAEVVLASSATDLHSGRPDSDSNWALTLVDSIYRETSSSEEEADPVLNSIMASLSTLLAEDQATASQREISGEPLVRL